MNGDGVDRNVRDGKRRRFGKSHISELTAFDVTDEPTGTWESRVPGFSKATSIPHVLDFQRFKAYSCSHHRVNL